MEIWKPKWEEYKKTDSYKEFCLEKQDGVASLVSGSGCRRSTRTRGKRGNS